MRERFGKLFIVLSLQEGLTFVFVSHACGIAGIFFGVVGFLMKWLKVT